MRTWGAMVARPRASVGAGGAVADKTCRLRALNRRNRKRRVDAVPAGRDRVGTGVAADRSARSAQAHHRRAGRRRAGRIDRAGRGARDAVRPGRPGAGARPIARPAAGRVLAGRGGRVQPRGAAHRRRSRGDADHRRARARRRLPHPARLRRRGGAAGDPRAAARRNRARPDAAEADRVRRPRRAAADAGAAADVLVLSARAGRRHPAFALGADDYDQAVQPAGLIARLGRLLR